MRAFVWADSPSAYNPHMPTARVLALALLTLAAPATATDAPVETEAIQTVDAAVLDLGSKGRALAERMSNRPVPQIQRPDLKAKREFSDKDPWLRRLARELGVSYPCTVETKHLGQFFNPTEALTFDDGRRREAVVVKTFSPWVAYKWHIQKLFLPSVPISTDPEQRFLNEQAMNGRFRSAGLKTLDIVLADPERRLIATRFLDGKGMDKLLESALGGEEEAGAALERLGSVVASAHRQNLCVGDLKPENVIVAGGEPHFIDLDQAAAGGDKAYDLAEFFHYAILVNRLSGEPRAWSRAAGRFLRGYRAGGGDPDVIRRARGARYLAPFGPMIAGGGWGALEAVRQAFDQVP